MLQYLFSPTKQFTYESGKLLDAGKIYVYIKDTTDLATLYDEDEDMISNPVILDANGRASVKADDTKEYRLEIYTNKDVLLYTCNAFYDGEGGGGISIVRHDDTLSGNGTSQSLLSVVNIPLAVDETMTAYKDTVEGKEALVLGVNGEWFNETFSGALSGKVDLSTFEECCSAMSAAVSGKVDSSTLENYYTKVETQNILNNYVNQSELNNYYLKTETSSREELQSAFDAVVTGGSSPNISAQSIYPEGVEQLNLGSTFDSLNDISANGSQNHNLDLGGVKYRLPDAYNIGSALYETNIFLPTSSFTAFSADNSANLNDLSGQIQYISGGVDYVSGGVDYISANLPTPFTGVSTNITITGDGLNDPLGIANPLGFGGAGTTATFSRSGLRVEDSAGNTATYYSTGINLDGATANSSTINNWNNVYNHVQSASGSWTGSDNTAVNQVVQQYSANGKWLTQTALNGYATTATLKLSAQVLSGRDNYLSAAIDYVSANAGRTYTGIEPVYVDNINNEIGVDQLAFSAGYGIDLKVTGSDTLVISSTLTGDLGHTYSGVSPIVVDNVANTISITGSLGHTYSGIAPIRVNNSNDTISISGKDLVGGYGIDIQPVGNYYLVSSNLFPMADNGFSANVKPSAISLLSQFSNVYLTNSSVSYAQAPSISLSATWYDIINIARNSNSGITVSSYSFNFNAPHVYLQLSALENLEQITFIAPWGGPTDEYSATFMSGNVNNYTLKVFSGCCQDIVKSRDYNSTEPRWYLKKWEENYGTFGQEAF